MPLDAARDAVIVVQARVIGALAAENTRLAGQVADLAARVERLERLASRNSGNSSMPPSADDLPGRTPPRRKPSPGFVHGLIARAAAAVAEANRLIRALIILAHVICADETPSGSGRARRPASATCWSPAPSC